MSSEVIIDVGKLLVHTLPFIIIGVGYGLLLARTRADVMDEVHENNMKFMDMASKTMMMHVESMKVVDQMATVCMRNDRFEFVDVKKEELENDRSKNNNGHRRKRSKYTSKC